MLRASPTNRWRYGGIIQRCTWEADDGRVRMWDGTQQTVRQGDTVLIFWTGRLGVEFVGTEQPNTEEAAL